MDNEALIEMIAKRIEAGYIIMSNPENARRDAQAALAALKAEGWMLVRWEKQAMHDEFERAFSRHITISVNDQPYKLTGLEPPDAEEDDPTPWCHICGARTKDQCHCGPIARND